jgi:alpha-ketoglutaric semialdehyde dehydrogenase
LSKSFKNFIAGQWVDAASGETFENRNPAHWNEIIGIFPKSSIQDVDRAVHAARDAFEEWRLVPVPERAEIMKKAGDLLVERKEEIAQQMTREMGKVIAETRGDVQEGIDTAYYAFGEGRRLFGTTVPSELRNKFNLTVRQPVGVAGIITPWNFPLAIPTWKIFPALLCGNTVVFKPASDTPATATTFVEVLVDAGVPPAVVQLVHGMGSSVGMSIVEHPEVNLISFTGSSAVGRIISASAAQNLKRVSLELGGKNAQIVMDDADLNLALKGVLWGAFGTTGQRCTATSRLILHERIYPEFMEMLVEATRGLKCGDGLDPATDVGPLINKGQRDIVEAYVKIGKEEGANIVTGGGLCTEPACADGWFYQPTILEATPDMRVAQEEIFGPVLSVLKVKSLDDAITVLNNTRYGLSSSIYTNDVTSAFTAMRDIQAGITYINGPTIGAECHMPFGGVKDTGNGHREGGWGAYDFFTEVKTIYVDFSGRLQRAQIDNR